MTQTHQTSTRRPPSTSTPTPAAHDDRLVDSMDELLDEIDSVLEENVIETIRAYRQRGGE